MSILDSIKGERKLSFGHWRYRILHWAFNVEDPDPKNTRFTGLPLFLYTHYCPLFHLTNLIAILSPLILLVRFFILAGRALRAVIDLIPFDYLAKYLPKKKLKVPAAPKVNLAAEKRKCIECICCYYGDDFKNFWDCHLGLFPHLDKELVKALFAEYMSRVEEARRLAKIRKDAWRERIIFWTNFSRVFIKWAMSVIYIGLTWLLFYGVYELLGIVWWCMCQCGEFIYWLFTDAITFSALLFLGKLFLWVGLAWVLLYFLIRLKVVQRFADVFMEGVYYIAPPFFIIFVPFRWIKNGFINIVEFVAMFYEENCPPISLVTEEEAVVESVAQNGEEV